MKILSALLSCCLLSVPLLAGKVPPYQIEWKTSNSGIVRFEPNETISERAFFCFSSNSMRIQTDNGPNIFDIHQEMDPKILEVWVHALYEQRLKKSAMHDDIKWLIDHGLLSKEDYALDLKTMEYVVGQGKCTYTYQDDSEIRTTTVGEVCLLTEVKTGKRTLVPKDHPSSKCRLYSHEYL